MVDSESPIYPNYSLEHGRLGTNLIRYHIFGGLLPYYTQLLGLFFLSASSVLMSAVFRFRNAWFVIFTLMFLTFPQHAYQLAFTMQADAIGIGYFCGAAGVYLFVKKLQNLKIREFWYPENLLTSFLIVILMAFTVSIYQALIFVPVMIFAALFLKRIFEDDFDLKTEITRSLIFIGLLVAAVIIYFLALKIFIPNEGSGYLSTYASGQNQNRLHTFWKIFKENLTGTFYYGNQLNILVLLSAVVSIMLIFRNKKKWIFKLLTLLLLLVIPYSISYFITNDSHPPRIFIGSTVLFAFLPVFILKKFLPERNLTWFGILVFLVNTFFITQLFVSAHRIYEHDLQMAKDIDREIKSQMVDYKPNTKYVYLHGAPSSSEYEGIIIPDSEVFGGSIFRWDRGSNGRMLNFLRFHDLGNYKQVLREEVFNTFKDSVDAMPLWPEKGSVRKLGEAVVVKFADRAGAALPFQKEEQQVQLRVSTLNTLPPKSCLLYTSPSPRD